MASFKCFRFLKLLESATDLFAQKKFSEDFILKVVKDMITGKSSSPPLSDNLNGENIGNTSHRKGWRREQEIACRNELGNCQRMYKGNAQGCGSSKVGCLQRGFRATESSMSLSDCKLNLTHFQNNTIQYTLNCIYF